MTITSMRLMQYQATAAQPPAAVPAAPAVAAPAPMPAPAPAVAPAAAPSGLFDWHAAQGRLSGLRNELSTIRQQIEAMLKGLQPAPAPQPTPVAAPAPTPTPAPTPAPRPPKPAAPPKDAQPAPKPEPKPAPKPEPKPKPKPKPAGSGPTLKEGHGGKPVRALQQRLNKLGFNAGAVDGLFGNQTEAALKRFEKKHGLKVDGVADKRVWNELGIKVKGKPQRIADMTVKTPDGPMVRRQGKLINASIAKKFDQMAAAAKRAGVSLQINNSYRSYQEQVVLWNRYGQDPARVARPGTSNHQTGKAIDFVNTPGAWAWLKANAHKYGLHNYPPEPWHYSPTGSGAPGAASTPAAETLEVIPIGL